MSKSLTVLFFVLTAEVFVCVCLHKNGNYYKVYHRNAIFNENKLTNTVLKKYFQIENKTKNLVLPKHDNIKKRDNLITKTSTEIKRNIKNETNSIDETGYSYIIKKAKTLMSDKFVENIKEIHNVIPKSRRKAMMDMKNETKCKTETEYDYSYDEKFLLTFFNGSRKSINKNNEKNNTQDDNSNTVKIQSDVINKKNALNTEDDISNKVERASDEIIDGNETTTQGDKSNEVASDSPLISHIEEKYDIVIKNCVLANNKVKLNTPQMADIWETIYYDLPNKVQCFRMHIKKVTAKDQNRYGRIYGTFNGKVKWNLCNLEIESSKLKRKHFLQGDGTDNGVLENIVFEDYGESGSLVEAEGPDQWMVIKNLLLMRDCRTGHVVVFARVPYTPSRFDVVEALQKFGEDVVIGKIACDNDDNVLSKLNRPVFGNNYNRVNGDVLFDNNFKI